MLLIYCDLFYINFDFLLTSPHVSCPSILPNIYHIYSRIPNDYAVTMDFIAIDFETANEHPTSACELGIAVVRYYKIVETRSWLIRPPEIRFLPYNSRLHGISANDVCNERDFGELWNEVLPYFKNHFVIAHNAGFDMEILRQLLLFYQIPFENISFTCSIKIARKVWKEYHRYGLKSLSRILSIELDHHRAESDARACAIIASMAFRENQVSIIEELQTKLQIQPGFISPERFVATGYQYAHRKTKSQYPGEIGERQQQPSF